MSFFSEMDAMDDSGHDERAIAGNYTRTRKVTRERHYGDYPNRNYFSIGSVRTIRSVLCDEFICKRGRS